MPSHDQIFKDLLSEFFGDFLRIVVPRFAEKLKTEDAKPIDKELFTAQPEGDLRVLDLLLEVPAHEGESEIVLIHVEVEAEARATMARRLLEYALTLRLEHEPPILPIVVYVRGGKPDVVEEVYREELWGRDLLTFTYWAFSLSPSEAEKYLERPEPVSWALSALMRPGELGRVGLKLASLERIAAGELDEAQRGVLVNFVKTELQLTEEEEMAYQEALARDEHRDVAEIETTWFDRIRAQGREEGREEGEAKGLQDALLAFLRRRFGPLPDRVVEAARAVHSRERLTELVAEAAVVESLDELPLDGS